MRPSLRLLSNAELAHEMALLTKRYGELCLWIAESELKIHRMIVDNREVQSEIAREIDLKQKADLEKWIVLSNLKRIELEMDRRVEGVTNG